MWYPGWVEKESGRQFERPVYRSLVDNILREGDLLVVTELKRFGRNYSEIYKEWFHITKEIGADIRVTSMPILDTTQSKELVGQLITDVVLARRICTCRSRFCSRLLTRA